VNLLKKIATLLSRQLTQVVKKAARNTSPKASKAALRVDSAVLFVFAGLASWLGGQKEATDCNLRQAVQRAPGSVGILVLYAKSQSWKGHLWQQLETLERYKEQFHKSFWYCTTLGQLQLTMYRFQDARHSLEQAVTLRKRCPRTWWLLGRALEGLGESDASRQAYARAVAQSWHPSVRRWGVGVWFAQQRLWEKAVHAYGLQMQQGSCRQQAHLLILRAKAHEHLLNWAQAANDYEHALSFPAGCRVDESLAWAHAQASQWAQALAACQQGLEKASPIWARASRRRLHRLAALCLHQQGQPRQAAEQFTLAYRTRAWWQRYLLWPAFLPQPKSEYREHARQAYAYMEQARHAWGRQGWAQAAASLEMVVQRWPAHAPRLFIARGHALVGMGEWDAACQTFRQASLYRWPATAAQRELERKQAQRRVMEYTEYLETLPINPQTVLYESYSGVSVSCNPYAIYQAVVDAPQFAGWTHVWVLNDLSRIPEDCAGRANVIFVPRDSQLYQRYLATAGWLVNNSTFPSYFIRRDGQRYLNTWHGTPLKTLGKDIRGNFMEHKNTARNLLHATHVLSPNPHTSHVLIERNDIAGLYQGQLAQTGYPRNDLVVNATAQQKAQFRQKLGLAGAGKPLVLYAPTWRGILGHPQMDSHQLIADLRTLQQQQDCEIVFRGHYFAEKALAEAGLDKVHIAPQAMDTSELLACTDVLITDYSSIFFDYLPTGRPILFYTYDLEQYSQERGLYFDMEEMPGPNCTTLEQLSTQLHQTLTQLAGASWAPDARYRAAQQKFSPNEDGHATRRAVEFFFENKSENTIKTNSDGRKTLLFYAGAFAPMGITTAAINLISALNAEQYRIVVAIDPDAVGSHPERIERLSRLPAHVQIIGRVGRQVCSPQERSVIDSFHRHDRLGMEQWPVYATAFEREFRRMFGDWQPTNVINYDGYTRFWAGLLAYGPKKNIRRLIYLHNDMYGEWQVKFPHLAGMFALYSQYDFLVSVAKPICQNNQKNLAERFSISKEKFVFADNMPDFDGVRCKAQQPLDSDLSEWLANTPQGQVFVCIGRFSPEKNHSLLLQAFALLLQVHPHARLIILGNGPLRATLESQIEQLGIGHAVLLPGLRTNPFPLLQRSDCFVLPSLHEGQPMVLLEALALGKPIVATDIPGVHELLAPGYGRLVRQDAAHLAQAFDQQIENKGSPLKKMDQSTYKANVLVKFEALLESH